MSVFEYLELQPVEDGPSELNEYLDPETFNLDQDVNGDELIKSWNEISTDMHDAV